MKRAALPIFLLLIAGALFATGCPERTRVADIERNPSRFTDKDVAIAGTVRDSYGFSIPGTKLGGGAYKIDDGTGEIWVVSKRSGAPRKGAKVGAKGRVYQGFNFGGRNFGTVIEESDRRTK